MKNKRNICILLIFLVFMITISAASAADDATSDLTSMDESDEITLEDSPNEEIILSDESENLVLEDNDVNEKAVSEANDEEPKLSESAGTFTDLENDINGNNDTEISLKDGSAKATHFLPSNTQMLHRFSLACLPIFPTTRVLMRRPSLHFPIC